MGAPYGAAAVLAGMSNFYEAYDDAKEKKRRRKEDEEDRKAKTKHNENVLALDEINLNAAKQKPFKELAAQFTDPTWQRSTNLEDQKAALDRYNAGAEQVGLTKISQIPNLVGELMLNDAMRLREKAMGEVANLPPDQQQPRLRQWQQITTNYLKQNYPYHYQGFIGQQQAPGGAPAPAPAPAPNTTVGDPAAARLAGIPEMAQPTGSRVDSLRGVESRYPRATMDYRIEDDPNFRSVPRSVPVDLPAPAIAPTVPTAAASPVPAAMDPMSLFFPDSIPTKQTGYAAGEAQWTDDARTILLKNPEALDSLKTEFATRFPNRAFPASLEHIRDISREERDAERTRKADEARYGTLLKRLDKSYEPTKGNEAAWGKMHATTKPIRAELIDLGKKLGIASPYDQYYQRPFEDYTEEEKLDLSYKRDRNVNEGLETKVKTKNLNKPEGGSEKPMTQKQINAERRANNTGIRAAQSSIRRIMTGPGGMSLSYKDLSASNKAQVDELNAQIADYKAANASLPDGSGSVKPTNPYKNGQGVKPVLTGGKASATDTLDKLAAKLPEAAKSNLAALRKAYGDDAVLKSNASVRGAAKKHGLLR